MRVRQLRAQLHRGFRGGERECHQALVTQANEPLLHASQGGRLGEGGMSQGKLGIDGWPAGAIANHHPAQRLDGAVVGLHGSDGEVLTRFTIELKSLGRHGRARHQVDARLLLWCRLQGQRL